MLLALAALLGAPAAFAIDSGDIIVVSLKGEVRITMNGAERNVRAGGVLELPAQVHTGRDGNVELKQGATTVSVGPETLLEFPALEKRGAPIDRIVQPRGNAFYSIGKREGRKLRVETPYLVGVIKGTQFNVAAEGDATTISLFEGLLEVRATDDSDVVDLKAGEIASRKRGEKSISIIKMDSGKAPPTGSRPSSGGGSNDGTPSPVVPRANDGGESLLVDRPAVVRPDVEPNTDVRTGDSSLETGAAANVGAGNGLDVGTNVVLNAASSGVDVGAGASVSLGNTVDATVNAGASIGPSGLDVATNVGVDAGPVAADLGVSAGVNFAPGAVDVSTNVGVDAGPIAADLGVNAGVNVATGAVDVSTNVGVDVGPVTADLGASTGVDLAAGSIDTSANAGIDAGPLTTNLVAGAAVDLPSGAVGTAVDVGVGTPVVDVALGADVAANVAAGIVNVGLDVAGIDLGLGVDLGLGDSNNGNGNDVGHTDPGNPGSPSNGATPVIDVGGLLNGLIRRPGRK